MCIRCLKEGLLSSIHDGEGKKRPRWCPPGDDEEWWVKNVYVDTLGVLLNSSKSSSVTCQLRYCYTHPVVLCTPCSSQTILTRNNMSLSAKHLVSDSVDANNYIPQRQPPCWLIIPDINESFLGYSLLMRMLNEQGVTVWAYDPRGQGLSENSYSDSCCSVDKLESHASDIKAILLLMKERLSPCTVINVLAYGIMARFLLNMNILLSDVGNTSSANEELCKTECSGETHGMVGKVVCIDCGVKSICWRLQLPTLLTECFPVLQEKYRLGCPSISSGLAVAMIKMQKRFLHDTHSLISLLVKVKSLSRLLHKLIALSIKLFGTVFPHSVVQMMRTWQELMSLQELPAFETWTHNVSSIAILTSDQRKHSFSQLLTLHRRYPFLKYRSTSMALGIHMCSQVSEEMCRANDKVTGKNSIHCASDVTYEELSRLLVSYS